jgi:hypothetical protein
MAHKSIPFLILHRLSRQQQQLVKKQGTIMPHTQLVLVHPSGCGTSADLNQTPSQCNVGGISMLTVENTLAKRRARRMMESSKEDEKRSVACRTQEKNYKGEEWRGEGTRNALYCVG